MVDRHDPDEHPSSRRAAGWVVHGWADAGLVGGAIALVVALWARLRRRNPAVGRVGPPHE